MDFISVAVNADLKSQFGSALGLFEYSIKTIAHKSFYNGQNLRFKHHGFERRVKENTRD